MCFSRCPAVPREEAPEAYKDVDLVVETVTQAGITGKVARLKPLVVIKG